MRAASNSQEREEQMQTGTEHNIVFRPSSSQGPAADRQSSSPSFQNPQLVSQRAGEITDDDDLPQVSTLQRESSSEGVRIRKSMKKDMWAFILPFIHDHRFYSYEYIFLGI